MRGHVTCGARWLCAYLLRNTCTRTVNWFHRRPGRRRVYLCPWQNFWAYAGRSRVTYVCICICIYMYTYLLNKHSVTVQCHRNTHTHTHTHTHTVAHTHTHTHTHKHTHTKWHTPHPARFTDDVCVSGQNSQKFQRCACLHPEESRRIIVVHMCIHGTHSLLPSLAAPWYRNVYLELSGLVNELQA